MRMSYPAALLVEKRLHYKRIMAYKTINKQDLKLDHKSKATAYKFKFKRFSV